MTPGTVEAVQELRSNRCRCGSAKQKAQTFCRACYFTLSPADRKALYTRLEGGYVSIYQRACKTLDAAGRKLKRAS